MIDAKNSPTPLVTPSAVSMAYGQTGAATRMNELGMRTM
jgi:hypothetical protein